jgi:hypothetical protein
MILIVDASTTVLPESAKLELGNHKRVYHHSLQVARVDQITPISSTPSIASPSSRLHIADILHS